jgi:hypothetical protein
MIGPDNKDHDYDFSDDEAWPLNTIDSPQEGADLGASARSDDAKTALSKQVATFDELKYRAENMLYNLFYRGLEAGEDTRLQYQFEREPAYKLRYIERCLKGSKDELAYIITALIDLQPSDVPSQDNGHSEAQITPQNRSSDHE